VLRYLQAMPHADSADRLCRRQSLVDEASSRRHTPNQRRTFGGIRRLFSSAPKARKEHSAYRPTVPKLEEGPACRIYGSVKVKKVTANLHVTTLGHGYMSFEHTDHHRE
jgi:hypothetical protein